MHVDIRSLFNKISDVKNLILQEKPHILGISEAEVRKNNHQLEKLTVPGYDLLLPKSWATHGKARLVVYIKKTLEYKQHGELEMYRESGSKMDSRILVRYNSLS